MAIAMSRTCARRRRCRDPQTGIEHRARSLEAELDRCGARPDTPARSITLAQSLARDRDEISPRKSSAMTEIARIDAILRRPIRHRTSALLSTADQAAHR